MVNVTIIPKYVTASWVIMENLVNIINLCVRIKRNLVAEVEKENVKKMALAYAKMDSSERVVNNRKKILKLKKL